MFRNFSFDWISFFLGILSGLLIWFIISQARSFFPQIGRLLKEKLEDLKKQQLAGAAGAIRQATYKRAQSAHLGNFFVPLNEILIIPQFLAPPVQTIPGSPPPPETISDQIVPFLPFHPEFTATFSPHRLTFQQLLSSGANIAVIGAPGSGKTVALAYLASALSRSPESGSNLASYLPIYLHVHEFNLKDDISDPLSALTAFIQKTIPSIFQKQAPSTILSALKQKKLILILDGLDDLHPEKELPRFAEFIKTLHKLHPGLLMVVAANPHYMNGLVQSNFYPFILAPFSEDQKNRLFEKWATCWSKYILSKKSDAPSVDPRLDKYWARSLPSNLNLLEQTLQIWSLFSGDLQQGQISYSGIEMLLNRCVSSERERIAIEKLAAHFITNQCSVMAFSEIEAFLNQFTKGQEKTSETDSMPAETIDSVRKIHLSDKSEKKSSGAQLIDRLISTGVLQEYSSNLIGFSHPQVSGYLAAFALPADLPRSLFESLFWSYNSETLHYIVTQGGNDLWIDTLLRLEDRPLYWVHFTIGGWLRDAPASSIWRSNFLRRLITLIHKEDIPLSIRSGFYAALLSSADSSLGVVVKQLLTSPSPAIRRLSAFAAGYLHATGMINDLLDLMSDPDPEVGLSAILALGSLTSPQSQTICADILLNAGELERQASAESLVRTKSGQESLVNALTSDDLLARRAAVHGLSLIRSSEMTKLMEKVSVEDGQWIVRTAAAEALDWMHRSDPHIPIPLSEPTETPWMISFASKSGIVFSRGQATTPILLDALKNGSPEERLRALDYLALEQEESIIGTLYGILYGPSEILSRSAIQSLWIIAAGGASMPSQTKYGFG